MSEQGRRSEKGLKEALFHLITAATATAFGCRQSRWLFLLPATFIRFLTFLRDELLLSFFSGAARDSRKKAKSAFLEKRETLTLL